MKCIPLKHLLLTHSYDLMCDNNAYCIVTYILHPLGSIKQENISFLLKEVETEYEVCTVDGNGV